MRKVVLAAFAISIAACSKTETPASDTAAPPAASTPAPLTNADLAGTWEAQGMPMDKDTVVVRFTMNNTDTGEGSSVVFPSGVKVVQSSRYTSGDSVVSESGNFKSQVRRGQQVTSTRMVLRLRDGKLVGTSTSKYASGDSASFRITATKKP